MPAQRIDGKRFRVGFGARRAAVIRECDRHRAAYARALNAGHALPKADRVLYFARTQLGKPYCLWGCRCDDCPCRDCSGLICYAENKANAEVGNGVHICTSSFGYAQLCRDAGLLISLDEALWTPGSVGILNPWGDPNYNGSNGHIFMFLGDGEHIIEEAGHAYGCIISSAGRYNIDICALLPGVDYTKPSPIPVYQQELDMFVQHHHYDMKTGQPTRPTAPPPGLDSVIHVAQDGHAIMARNDASIYHDQPVDPKHPKALRYWTSPGQPLPADVRFIAVCPREADGEDPHPGGIALCSDGTQRRFRLS